MLWSYAQTRWASTGSMGLQSSSFGAESQRLQAICNLHMLTGGLLVGFWQKVCAGKPHADYVFTALLPC